MREEKKPIVAITMGDPCGIGPEVCIKGLKRHEIYSTLIPLVIGDQQVLDREIKRLNIPLELNCIHDPRDVQGIPGIIDLIPVTHLSLKDAIYGMPTAKIGQAVYHYIEVATKLVLEGMAQAITTLPINKKVLHMAGYHYPGHTELLAILTGTTQVVMMLAGSRLKVTLVTTHLPLSDVPHSITPKRLAFTITTTNQWLIHYFGIKDPRIAVSALNPHAGEEGLFGDQEIRTIRPVIEQCQAKGLTVSGPMSPDTVFYQAVNGFYDVVVCMYHDQALIPLKLLHFEDGVNITLGLPIIRTSVDHGTAYDIAGQGMANEKSFLAALYTAANMALTSGMSIHG